VTNIVCSTLWYSASLLPMHSSAMRAIDGTSFDQAGFCTAVPPLHVAREKSAESVGRELGNGYHDHNPTT
jgi:hypothetical protein